MEKISEGVLKFIDDDKGYGEWIKANADGFVINTFRTPDPKYLKTHSATCRTIKELQKKATSFTSNGYIKFCSKDLSELKAWAKSTLGTELQHCLKCLK